eukprot:6837160-Prymnesium_polylepis.1
MAGLVDLTFLRAMRMLRILRMVRLLKQWKGLFKIVMTLVKSLPQMSNVIILMMLVIVVFALVGKELLGGKLGSPDESLTRHHFDSFVPAMITTFVLISGKWYDPLVVALTNVGWGAAVFYLIVVVIGCYFIMNLFIAVLLQVFALEMNNENETEAADPMQNWRQILRELDNPKVGATGQ